MMSFLKRHSGTERATGLASLGPLELALMEILWKQGESSVHQVIQSLERPLAYTTVMTTCDRLYKKGFLERRKSERAYIYSPRQSQQEWEHQLAADFMAGYLVRPHPAGELLISCLVDAVGQQSEKLLDDLEKKIRLKRKELEQKGKI
jgi:predicted transcriptional regulator